MRLLIHMHLESDAIFGNGMSMPGGEDICIQSDDNGFPYVKGSTLKGLFREMLIQVLLWDHIPQAECKQKVVELMGESGANDEDMERKLVFSDMVLHPKVKNRILQEKEIGYREIQEMFTYKRTFTSLENGMVKKGSLRSARCIKSGLNFYGVICCREEDENIVREVFSMMKWLGTMRSRGFGKVMFRLEEVA